MKIRVHEISAVVLVSMLGGCTHRDVAFTISNPLAIPQAATLQEYTGSGAPTGGPYYTGSINANSSINYPLKKISVGDSFAVTGQAQLGAAQKVTIVKGDGEQQINLTLSPTSPILTDAQSAEQLLAAFLVLGPQSGFPPMDLHNALQTVIGAVRCYSPPTKDNPFADVVWSKPPGVLTPLVPTPASFPYKTGFVSKDAEVTSNASATVSVSVPLYGSLSGKVGSTGLDKYHIQYTNFGELNKVEDAANFTSVADALNKLSEADKKALLSASSGANIVCTYFNSFYAIQTINLTVQHSSQISTAGNVTASTVFTATGAYDFSSATNESAVLSDNVVNVWGDNFKVARDASSTDGHTVLLYNPVTARDANREIAGDAFAPVKRK